MPRARRSVLLIAVALVLAGGIAGFTPSPVAAQCLSPAECEALKEDFRDLRERARALRGELRELRERFRALPEGSPERETLKTEARKLRRELRKLRKEEVRPLKRKFRRGCRRC